MKKVEKFFDSLVKDHENYENIKEIPVEIVKIPLFNIDKDMNICEPEDTVQSLIMKTYRCTDENRFGDVFEGAKKIFLYQLPKDFLKDNSIKSDKLEGNLIIRSVDGSFKIRMIIIK